MGASAAARLWASAAVAIAVSCTRSAVAQPSRPIRDAVALEAGASCLESATLVEHIQTWLGSDALAADLSIEVRGSAANPRDVRFEVRRGAEIVATRRFDPGPESCENLHAAVGLAVAMALGASLPGAAPVPERAPAVASRPAPTDTGVKDRWAFGVSSMATANVLPQGAFGIDAAFTWSFTPSLALRFGWMALASIPGAFDSLPGHYDSALGAAHIGACAGADASPRVRIQVCTAFAGGVLGARGHSFTVSEAVVAPWTAMENEIQVLPALGPRWSLSLSLGIALPLQRQTLVVRSPAGATVGSRELGPLGAILSLGAIYRL